MYKSLNFFLLLFLSKIQTPSKSTGEWERAFCIRMRWEGYSMAVVPNLCSIARLDWSCLGLLWVGSEPERQRLTAIPISCFFCQGNSMLWFIFLCLYVVICVINTCKNLLLKAISKIVNWWIKSLELTLLRFALGLCNIVSRTLNQSINLTCFNKPHNECSITVLLSLSVTLSTFLHLITDILLLTNNGTFISCQNPT